MNPGPICSPTLDKGAYWNLITKDKDSEEQLIKEYQLNQNSQTKRLSKLVECICRAFYFKRWGVPKALTGTAHPKPLNPYKP